MKKPTKKDIENRERLRYFLKWKEDLNEYVSGNGTFIQAMRKEESAEFSKLIRKYKYDKEFADQLALYSGR